MTVIQIFARFVVALDPPETAIEAATLCFVDWLGAAIAGAREMPAAGLRRALSCPGTARLIPDGAPADPRTAALINATASHTVEVDDIFRSGLYHPGVVTIPAALALGEDSNASGAEFLRAIVAGYEVSNRIARAVNPAHYRYWHTTGTVGHLGAAVAAASVLRLNEHQTAHAMATAVTFAAGLRHAFSADAMSKPLHAGRAAEAGVLAALAAREGVTGVADMLEGLRGFGNAMADGPDWGAATETLGSEWTITATTPKAHACCGHNFAALDAISELRTRHGLRPADIASIDIHTYRAALDICGNPTPVSAAEGRFSLPWCAAVMVANGAVTPVAFTPDAMSNEITRALSARIRLFEDAKAEARFPDARSATVSIRTVDGRCVEHHRPTRKGDPDDPMTPQEIYEKFTNLTAPCLGTDTTFALASSVRHTYAMSTVRDLPFPQKSP